MRFRPCIDIHNGCVKQIVGGSLKDQEDQAEDNFVSQKDGAFYGSLYQRDQLLGGHIILLNPATSPYYQQDLQQAQLALQAFPHGLQIGGGVNLENCESFLDMGASHVIVTSFVFREGQIDFDRLRALKHMIGRDHLVLDLSCRKYGDDYYIVTDRWQKKTEQLLQKDTLQMLAQYCDEFLIHAVDVEGKVNGIDTKVLQILAQDGQLPITYAGGIHTLEDIQKIQTIGQNQIDFTVGSALDLFGGTLPYQELIRFQ